MVHFGFSIIILIMVTLAFIWLNKIKDSNEEVLDLIEQYDVKIEYAYKMRSVVLHRYNLLLTMLFIEDDFELDEKVSNFHEVGYGFRVARLALHALPMSNEEKKLHDLIDLATTIPHQYNLRAAELFRTFGSRDEILQILREAKKPQSELLLLVEKFIALQRENNEKAKEYSKKIFEQSVFWISLFGLIGFLVSILISRYVGKAVADKNDQLLEASKEMAAAYKKAEEATVVKSDFLATMSHEMRTPLTAIIGFAETTLFSEQTIEQRQNAIQTIIRSGKHLLQIINNILDLSKVEANKIEIENVELLTFDLLTDVELIVRPMADEKGLGFSINYIFPLPKKITNDALRLKQILINLCNNAVKFTEEGYILINVSSNTEEGRLFFEVVDSGVGISEEQQKFIFDAYRQADSSTTRRFGGTGLGLSLSKELAKHLGGTLTVESKLGKGSKFILKLDFDIADEKDIVFDKEQIPVVIEKRVKVKPTVHLSGHVLLAEDNKDNQELFTIYLRRMGLEVTIVENGQEAIDIVNNNNFDLVLMDMRMPVLNGIDAMKTLRKNGFTKPIIALTANAMREDQDACYEAGADGFLSKPINVDEFTNTLKSYLKTAAVEKINDAINISDILKNDPGAIELIKNFVGNLTGNLDEIDGLIRSQSWKDLIEALNKLKSSSGSVGCPSISVYAGKMEFQATSHNSDELTNLFKELNEYCDMVLKELKQNGIV